MKRIVLFMSGLLTCAVLAVSVQGGYHTPPEMLEESLQKEKSKEKESQAAEADRRAKQALAPFQEG